MPGSVAVLGASGFTGTALVEHLCAVGDYEVRCFAHSARNASSLARLGVGLGFVDLLDRKSVEQAIAGCDLVVNCTMGPRDVMFEGLGNLLEACAAQKVRRFVHLSSITVYGDPPPPDSVRETARPRPRRGTYGWIKLQQDRMVQAAARRGLPSVVLCPPIVSGPRSTQLRLLVEHLLSGKFVLVGDGAAPCPLVDVRNLAHAIERAFHAESVDGQRIFVLDEQTPTWGELIEGLENMLRLGRPVRRISGDEARTLLRVQGRRSFQATLRHLASPGVRRALLADPLLASWAGSVKRALPRKLSAKLRNARSRTPAVRSSSNGSPVRPDNLQLERQLRGVRHQIDTARRVLQYSPPVSLEQSLQDFCAWYAHERGWDSEVSDLVAQLEQVVSGCSSHIRSSS